MLNKLRNLFTSKAASEAANLRSSNPMTASLSVQEEIAVRNEAQVLRDNRFRDETFVLNRR